MDSHVGDGRCHLIMVGILEVQGTSPLSSCFMHSQNAYEIGGDGRLHRRMACPAAKTQLSAR
jgi:hypothetical protein